MVSGRCAVSTPARAGMRCGVSSHLLIVMYTQLVSGMLSGFTLGFVLGKWGGMKYPGECPCCKRDEKW